MSVSIPTQKLDQLHEECNLWTQRTKANKQMIQGLIGKLIYVANCVQAARKFTARILATLRSLKDKKWTTLSTQFKADVYWFLRYAKTANRVFLYTPDKPLYELECDSSLHCAGGNTDAHFYSWRYDLHHKLRFQHILHLEAINIVLAYKTCTPTFLAHPARVNILIDNITSSFMLHSGRTRNDLLAKCARELWLFAAHYNHDIHILHKKGECIPLANALSRSSHDPAKNHLAAELIKSRNLKCLPPALVDHFFFNNAL